MSNPNRLKVYYLYRCGHCGHRQLRGSRAQRCNYFHPLLKMTCTARIYRVIGAKARAKPLTIRR